MAGREVARALKAADAVRHAAGDRLKRVRYFQKNAAWLIEKFPNAEMQWVPGLAKVVFIADIKRLTGV